MKDSSKKTNRLTLFALLAAVIAIVLAYFGTLPLYQDFKKTSFNLAVKKQDIIKGKGKIDEVNQAYAKLRGMKEELGLLDVAVPSEPAVAEALIQINEIVSRAGLKISAITPSTEGQGETKGSTEELQISLAVQGPFRSLQEFVRLSEKNLRPVVMKSLTILAQEEEAGGLSGSYQLGLVYAGGKPKEEKGQKGGEAGLEGGLPGGAPGGASEGPGGGPE